MVFWRDMGWKEEDEAVEARDGVCNMMDIVGLLQFYDNEGSGSYAFRPRQQAAIAQVPSQRAASQVIPIMMSRGQGWQRKQQPVRGD